VKGVVKETKLGGEGRVKIREIDIKKIVVKDRIRDDLGDIKELAESIDRLGLINPITVKESEDGKYGLSAGQRRLEACKLLGWKTIPANVILE
jgi:ParB family chromosome partitioning protein